MGYFGEQGTKVTWKNPQFVAENQRQDGGWYFNPATNSVDRWWTGSAPQQQSNNQSAAQATNFSNGGDFNQILQQAQEMYKKASQPMIDSFNNLSNTTKQLYETQRQGLQAQISPLQDRYKALLDQIKGNQATAENRQTVVTRQEMAKRGIPLTSTMAQQEVTNAVNPITQQYSNLSKETTAGMNQDIASINAQINNLAPQEEQALNNIASQIAQINGGSFSSAVSTALQLLQNTQAQKQQEFENQLALQKLKTESVNPFAGNISTPQSAKPSVNPTVSYASQDPAKAQYRMNVINNNLPATDNVSNVDNRTWLQKLLGMGTGASSW